MILEIANDVIPAFRQPNESEMRDVVRARAPAISAFFEDRLESGEMQADPIHWLAKFMARDEDSQRLILRISSSLKPSEIDAFQPSALFKAWAEAVDFLRCIYSDNALVTVLLEEACAILPRMIEVQHR